MFNALIVDDEQPVRIAISKLANWVKYHINSPRYAENGREALKIMYEDRPDIVFLDIEMPVMDGTEFLKKAYQSFPDTAYIVISGYDNFEYARDAIRYNASDYLLKPIVADDLNVAIDRAMRAKHPDIDFSNDIKEDDIGIDGVLGIIKSKIDNEYMSEIRIADFSEKYYFSREYLIKIFKAKYGFGIYEYLTKVRMERAKELLMGREDMHIREIAERVGFFDKNYFSKAFKKYYGKTPSEMRSMRNR